MKNRAEIYHMKELWEKDKNFKFYPEARYATDIIFQQNNCPAGNISENKKYFSAKNHHQWNLNRSISST